MNSKHKLFVNEYLTNGRVGTLAAIAAKYSVKRADVTAAELLARDDIKAYIKAEEERLAKEAGISQKMILRELGFIAFSDIRKFYKEDGTLKSIADLDDDAAAALAGVEVDELEDWIDNTKVHIGFTKKIKRWDKVKAIETINKMLGYNAPEKKELTGPNGTPLSTIDYSKLSNEVLLAIIDASRK